MSFLEAGRLVTPSLRLVRELGRGGMGAVWIADHLGLQTQVAVKFLLEAATPEGRTRFEAEAAAAAKIRSPHVVQVLDHGVSDGTPFIVMELLEGEDLSRRLTREEWLAPAEVIAIVGQIAKALSRTHAAGIVHRDIKPANVFLVSNGDETWVKLLDFGLAKHPNLSVQTGSMAVFGTPHYVSPEQAEHSRAATPQSDLWSVAVMVYEALSGRRPFESDSIMGLCIALHEARFTRITAVRPDLPAALDDWFTRAFQLEPADRFASASELATSLASAFDAPPTRMRRWPLAGVALASVALAVPFTMRPAPAAAIVDASPVTVTSAEVDAGETVAIPAPSAAAASAPSPVRPRPKPIVPKPVPSVSTKKPRVIDELFDDPHG